MAMLPNQLSAPAQKPTHICLSCGAVGHAGGYHDHGNGDAGDTCTIAELLRIVEEAGRVKDERDELVQMVESAKRALEGQAP